MTEEIKIITQLGTEASQAAIAEYTRYYASSAIIWGWLCFAGLIVSILGMRKALKAQSCDPIGRGLAVLMISLFAICFVAGLAENIIQGLNPKAMAIHKLLRDVRGK